MCDFGQVPSFPKGGLESNLYKLEDIQKKVGHVHVLYILAGVNALNVASAACICYKPISISSNSRELNCWDNILNNMKYSIGNKMFINVILIFPNFLHSYI